MLLLNLHKKALIIWQRIQLTYILTRHGSRNLCKRGNLVLAKETIPVLIINNPGSALDMVVSSYLKILTTVEKCIIKENIARTVPIGSAAVPSWWTHFLLPLSFSLLLFFKRGVRRVLMKVTSFVKESVLFYINCHITTN